jgi:hypothetical protein
MHDRALMDTAFQGLHHDEASSILPRPNIYGARRLTARAAMLLDQQVIEQGTTESLETAAGDQRTWAVVKGDLACKRSMGPRDYSNLAASLLPHTTAMWRVKRTSTGLRHSFPWHREPIPYFMFVARSVYQQVASVRVPEAVLFTAICRAVMFKLRTTSWTSMCSHVVRLHTLTLSATKNTHPATG